MKFTELPIHPDVMRGIQDCGFTDCTDIQALALPLALEGKDIAGQAQTGTGKTAAFLIGLYTRLLNEEYDAPEEPQASTPRALVIAPTRELAVQIEKDALELGAYTGLKTLAVYGGVNYEKQRQTLLDGGIDLLIGTPGRLIDYLKQNAYSLKKATAVVIDEADRMFDMGFIADIRYMLRRLPPPAERLSMLFSATLSQRSQEMAWEHMQDPQVVSTRSDETEVRTAERVKQRLYYVEGTKKISLLMGILKKQIKAGEEGGGRTMIFINTKRMGEKLECWLVGNDLTCGYLSGDVPQNKRLKVLESFQKGEIPILIATDVAGRGLHIEGVTHVINYDMPEDSHDYVHRIGRTARAGEEGDAITFVDETGAYDLEAVEEYIKMKIPVEWAEDDLFLELKRPAKLKSYFKGNSKDGRGRGGGRGGHRDGQRGRQGPSRGRRR